MSHEPNDPMDPVGPPPTGTALLRAVAETMARVRHALEHGDVPAARHAAQHLVLHLAALPGDRAEYEQMCEAADRELEANPGAWDRPSEGPEN